MTHTFYGIDHVQLAAPAGCEAAARAFFADLLGMTEVAKPKDLRKRGGAWFQCGSQQLHVGVDSTFIAAKKAHPSFHVQNLSALRERILAQGIPVQDDGLLPGAERFYVTDPFGNRLEFLEWRDAHDAH